MMSNYELSLQQQLNNGTDESIGVQQDLQSVSQGNMGLQSAPTSRTGGRSSSGRGLVPTDGQDVYKRMDGNNNNATNIGNTSSNNRSSRRSRAERTSYLLATGHLNLEETKHLASESNDPVVGNVKENNNQEVVNYRQPKPQYPQQFAQHNEKIFSPTMLNIDEDKYRPGPSSLVGDHSFLDYVSMNNSNNDNNIPDNAFFKAGSASSFKRTKSKGGYTKSGSRHNGPENGRGKFQQTTYTEVTLPMKTSPAFEYILKDHRRRNRRCFLWLLYSILVTMCLALITFSGVHLLRHHYNN